MRIHESISEGFCPAFDIPLSSSRNPPSEINSCLAQKIVYAHIFTVKHMRYNFKP